MPDKVWAVVTELPPKKRITAHIAVKTMDIRIAGILKFCRNTDM